MSDRTMVAAIANTSYGPKSLDHVHVGNSITEYLASISGWKMAITLLVMLIVYDQGMQIFTQSIQELSESTDFDYSPISQKQRINRWTDVQAPIYGTIPSISEPEV